jgi:hypothetical protein
LTAWVSNCIWCYISLFMGRIIIATGLFPGGWIVACVRARETPAPDNRGYNFFNPWAGITVRCWQLNGTA